jgi:site-specific recombinase XerC
MCFADRNGNPYSYAVRFWFDKGVRDSGIKDCSFHTLRHTFASNLVKCNINLKVVQELLGHSNLSVTMKYAHLSPGLKQQAIQMLNTEMGLVKKWLKKGVEPSPSKTSSSKVLENERDYKCPRSSMDRAAAF